MSQLTEDQARELADNFLLISQTVGDFRFAHFSQLTGDQLSALRDLQHQLSDQSNHFTAVAIQTTLDDVQGTLDRITKVTGQVKEAVDHLNDARQAITIVSSLIALGTAIASGDPVNIAGALDSTATTLQAAKKS